MKIEWLKHPEYVEFMRKYIPGHTEDEIRKAFCARYHIILTEGQIGNFKNKYGVKSGTHGGCFKKGHEPSNKGKPMSPEVYEKVKHTMFHIGNMPTNHMEIGSERVNVDGYVEVKVAEPNRWNLKHRVVYEELHKVNLTSNDVIIFLDGNRQNLEPDNLFRMTRAELARYCKEHLYANDRNISRAAAQIAKIKARIGEIKNEAKTGN